MVKVRHVIKGALEGNLSHWFGGVYEKLFRVLEAKRLQVASPGVFDNLTEQLRKASSAQPHRTRRLSEALRTGETRVEVLGVICDPRQAVGGGDEFRGWGRVTLHCGPLEPDG